MSRRRATDYDWQVVWSERLLSMVAVPVDDLTDHHVDDIRCWCCPIVEEAVVIHNAADKRENWERFRHVDDAA